MNRFKNTTTQFNKQSRTKNKQTETLEFKHQKFAFDEWYLILQLDRFRAALTEGLQNHCESNPLMGEVKKKNETNIKKQT